MLEQVRETGTSLRLRAHADVVLHSDGNDRAGAVTADQDPQPVAQRRALDGNGGIERRARAGWTSGGRGG